MEKMVTMSGVYKSRCGLAATVLCVDKPHGQKVVAYLENGAVIICDESGRMNPKIGESQFDLVEAGDGR
jgi:hypothetical protein